MSQPYEIKWGILATGGIAATFTKDLLLNPSTRDVSDVKHSVVAAASSTSADRAQQFLRDCQAPSSAAAYGTYAELAADENVDIIYVATPHSHHFQNTMLCLNAGKHVLCEKAFTVNAQQARILVDTAREKGLFLMEAVWTRYFPLSIQIRNMVSEGKIGTVHRVIADNSFGEDIAKNWGNESRMVNMDLAGGSMLDLGIYSLTWVFQILYHLQPASSRKAPKVTSSIAPYPPTGADMLTSIICTFPAAPPATSPAPSHGVALTNFLVATDPDGQGTAGASIRIQGTAGEIQVFGPAYRPRRYRVIGREKGDVRDVECEIPGQGMFWEADEAARCVRDGKKESETLGWEESVVMMECMDEVRRQNGMVYPEAIESTVYKGDGNL
ncbi:MAG: hypothetical protein M1833_000231 [Piccolia ochrophora]|nr:MAG: hypothetical protein M1833_000231 [Piccolia ochrophora]